MLAPSLLDIVQHKIIKFVGGKFRDLEVNHENNENWHPTKITRYTVLLLSQYMYTTCIFSSISFQNATAFRIHVLHTSMFLSINYYSLH